MNKLPSKFKTPDQSPGLQLWRVTNLWQREMRLALRDFGLTHVQFVLLAVSTKLGEGSNTIHQALIAETAKTDKMMTSQVLRTLEDKEFLVRVADPNDKRAICISVTDAGRELVGRALAAVEAADARFFAALGDKVEGFTKDLLVLATAEPNQPSD